MPAFMDFAKTVKSHGSGIVHFVESRVTNGIFEGINNKALIARHRARGFINLRNFVNMIYSLCYKLKFDYPLYST
jgi:transposase